MTTFFIILPAFISCEVKEFVVLPPIINARFTGQAFNEASLAALARKAKTNQI